MTNVASLVEQHISLYESRMKHADELARHASSMVDQGQDNELQALISERDRLASHVEQMKLHCLDNWEKEELALAGPMGVWDALAQQFEKVIERVDH